MSERDEIIKVAAEYDSAGRIMARGFYDELCKLSTDVAGGSPPTHVGGHPQMGTGDGVQKTERDSSSMAVPDKKKAQGNQGHGEASSDAVHMLMGE